MITYSYSGPWTMKTRKNNIDIKEEDEIKAEGSKSPP